MTFAGVNYIAVVIAALAGFGTGAAWYMILGRFWLAAVGKKKEDMDSSPTPFLIAIVANLVMAIMLAGVIGHLGEVNIKTGVISGALIWLGFVITTMGVNHAFEGAKTALTLIDGGHWLAVLLVMGAVIGAFGI
jgi:hypothetical protein